ncbi:endonuclease/exonuclease/phosphatase family protein [Aestuariibaculum suncheonense]|uniref:Endonuclease/exonuclease/phosphatase family protein n=1 Tax=Aestuariibaculum suncheonense TaxID=1028745 RepID=A0A8J6QC53_9FLAO|nr:endonuclease/exonuclease/phosphatase family protein [Aestuariibaculum suncheonense]
MSCSFAFINCKNEKIIKLNVLQFNIWQEGTVVPNGFNAVVDEIIRTDADLIAFSEVRNYNGVDFSKHIVEALKEKGHTYYAQPSQDTGLLSKYPIIEQTALYPVKNDHGSITKAIIDVLDVEIAFYSGHLDYLNCALYLPRGYDGSTWNKLDSIVTDVEQIQKNNLESMRDDAIDVFIADAENEIKQDRLVIYGGDNNEPSHLDWIEANKNLYDHNGVVINWRNTSELENRGFKDAYREVFPNPLTHPGFTYPADNPLVPINKLAWSPEADDRDRIDFIFYYPDERLQLMNAKILGPQGDVSRNQRVLEVTEDVFLEPLNVWPTDHKAVLTEFALKF